MNLTLLFRQPLLLLLCTLLFACKKSLPDDESGSVDSGTVAPIGSSKTKPGLGVNGGMPEGLDLQLPPTIRMVSRPHKAFDRNPNLLYGHAQTFYSDISFVNDGPQTVTIELPAGLILVTAFSELQNGLLLQKINISIPPTFEDGEPADTTTIYLGVACLNEERSPPMGPGNSDYNIEVGAYPTVKVTTDANLLKLLELFKDKPGLRITNFVTNDPEAVPTTPLEKMYSAIQLAIYEITEGNGLPASDVKRLKTMLEQFR